MLSLIHRRELLITREMKRQGEVCRILREQGIPYAVRTTDLDRARISGMQGKEGYPCEYTIYVGTADYERARLLIGERV